MNPRKTSRRLLRRCCGVPGSEDGVDPRVLARRYASDSRRSGHRKTSQLCHQVAETIGEVLAEQPDDILRDLTVVDVLPAPDESRLLVTVAPGPGARLPGPIDVIQHLDASAALIRAEVAAAITRRRAPSLEFRYALPGGRL